MSIVTAFRIGEVTAQHLALIFLLLYLVRNTDEMLRYLKIDRTAPELVMKGDANVTHERGMPFVDPGATSPDPTATITVTGTVEGDEVGTYEISYVATDQSGNASPAQKRVVRVVDTTPPKIRLVGDATIFVTEGDAFVDPGAETDDPSATILTEGGVNTENPGAYTISYTAVDPFENRSETVQREVRVTEEPHVPSTMSVYYYGSILALIATIVYSVRRSRSRESEASPFD